MKARIIVFALGVLAATSASGYEQDTHRILSVHAASRSVLYQSGIVTEWGYGNPQSEQFASQDFAATTIDQMIANGAHHEDDLAQILRVFNHFFDPQFANYSGRGLAYGPVSGHSSPLWALEDQTEVMSIGVPLFSAGGVPQVFSLRNGAHYFFNALTAQAPAARRTEFGRVFQTLGHVVHHLQDMGQPQHVRNEIHPPAFTGDTAGGWYERYTSEYKNGEIPAILSNNAYPAGPPAFSTAREFWGQSPVPGPRYRGMADFSAHNYVGLRTNLRGNVAPSGTVTITGNPEFPLPSGTNRNGTPVRFEARTLPVRQLTGSIVTRTVRAAIGDVYDEYTGYTHPDKILAVESAFAPALIARRAQFRFVSTSSVFDDNYSVLLPRASAFSTGLINHFFRGRLELQRTSSTGTTWTITNTGTQAMNGEFYVYREDGNGNRSLAAGPWTRTVNAGQGADVTVPEPPSGTARMIAVFRGQVGAEGSVASGYYAVAGKVVNYTAQAIPCGNSFSAAGGTEGRETTMELGSTPGPVQGEFEAYSIPDSMVVRRTNSNGPVLYSSNGSVSGFHTFTIQHPGGGDPSQNKIWIKVTGNTDTATQWTSTISCPNRSITNADRERDRISISFSSTATGGGTGCPRGHFNVYLNDLFGGGVTRTVAWGGGGATSSPITITTGTNHWLRVQNVVDDFGTPGAILCSPPAKVRMNRPGGSVDINNYIGQGGPITLP